MAQYARYSGIGGGGGGGGSVNSVTASTPLSSTGGANPNISIQFANSVQSGFLTATDWNTFNSKQSALTFSTPLINTFGNVAINGSIEDNKLNFISAADATKIFTFNLSGMTTSASITLAPLSTQNETYNIPPLVDSSGTFVVQNNSSGQIFIGATSSIGGSNSGIQYSNALTANRAQIKLHSYFNGTSIAGVSTLTSRSGTIGVNNAVVAGQDYSKWTAQAGATTVGSAPISGTFAFKANSINSLTVPSDFHIQLTNLAGTLQDALYLTSEGNLTATGTMAASNLSGTNTGNVTLGTSNGLSLAGQTLSLALSSASTTGALSLTDWVNFDSKQSYYVDKFTLSGTDITNGFVTLASPPTVNANVNLTVIGGPMQEYGTDYVMIGSNLDWNGLFLAGVLIAGDKLVVEYY